MTKDTTKAHLALLTANIIYGANYIIAKGVMPNKIGPTAFVFIRLACCVLLFWGIKLLFVKEKVEKRDIIKLALCGLFGGAANQLFFFHGINLTSPIDASIIMTITPVIVLIFSYFILKEHITKNKILGIILGGTGAVLLILYGNKVSGTSSVLGNLFVLLNALSYGFYLILAKTLMHKYNAITVISWIFLFGFMYVFPLGIHPFLNTNFSAFTTETYLTIGYVVLFTTFFAYLFNIYALNHLAPSITSSYIYLQPAISFIMVSIMAYVFMQNQYAQDINLIKILSCGLVAIGVYLVSKPQKNKI
ncbi:DMT family transporter [Aestuariibaculum suncheonense]|uniref:DMT family transporter n=1 Tax=Aestuariibaculum suncheonense TaxID=1028745 RepID=A0A8J6Q555_9FLAO|nr:DMT family transporter [Aestuariibaculum suncheonense]MBD0834085.1 DMT family transporter [Aestuariibaculum suncheonense]